MVHYSHKILKINSEEATFSAISLVVLSSLFVPSPRRRNNFPLQFHSVHFGRKHWAHLLACSLLMHCKFQRKVVPKNGEPRYIRRGSCIGRRSKFLLFLCPLSVSWRQLFLSECLGFLSPLLVLSFARSLLLLSLLVSLSLFAVWFPVFPCLLALAFWLSLISLSGSSSGSHSLARSLFLQTYTHTHRAYHSHVAKRSVQMGATTSFQFWLSLMSLSLLSLSYLSLSRALSLFRFLSRALYADNDKESSNGRCTCCCDAHREFNHNLISITTTQGVVKTTKMHSYAYLYWICVLILLHVSSYCMCPHTPICVLLAHTLCPLRFRILLYVSSYYYVCVRVLLYMSTYIGARPLALRLPLASLASYLRPLTCYAHTSCASYAYPCTPHAHTSYALYELISFPHLFSHVPPLFCAHPLRMPPTSWYFYPSFYLSIFLSIHESWWYTDTHAHTHTHTHTRTHKRVVCKYKGAPQDECALQHSRDTQTLLVCVCMTDISDGDVLS